MTQEEFEKEIELLGVETFDASVNGDPKTGFRFKSDGHVIKARWVPGIAEDMKIIHGIDPSATIWKVLLAQIELEKLCREGVPFEEAHVQTFGCPP